MPGRRSDTRRSWSPTLRGVTALVSVQMMEARATVITDAVLRDAIQDADGPRQRAGSERLAVLPYKIGDLARFRLVKSAARRRRALHRRSEGRGGYVEQPFLLIALVPGDAPKPEDRDAFAKRVFSGAPASRRSRSPALSRCASDRRKATRSWLKPRTRLGHRSDHRAVAALRTERLSADVRDRQEGRMERRVSEAAPNSRQHRAEVASVMPGTGSGLRPARV